MSDDVSTSAQNKPAETNSKSLGVFLVQATLVASLGFIAVFGTIGWMMFDEPLDALALGLFSAFWGGPGFAVIAAGVLWEDESDQLHTSEQRVSNEETTPDPTPQQADVRRPRGASAPTMG